MLDNSKRTQLRATGRAWGPRLQTWFIFIHAMCQSHAPYSYYFICITSLWAGNDIFSPMGSTLLYTGRKQLRRGC